MKRGDFIKAMSRKGWLLFRVDKRSRRTSFQCRHIGCTNAVVVTDDQIARGEIPRKCVKPHRSIYSGAVMQSHIDLQTHLRRARIRYGLSQEEVEAAAGLSVDHIGKLEIADRTATFPTYWTWAQTLGFDIVLVPKALPDQVVAIIEHKNSQPVPERRPPDGLLLSEPVSPDARPGTLSAIEGI